MMEMVAPPVRKTMPTATLISATTVCAFQPGLLLSFSVVMVGLSLWWIPAVRRLW